MRRSLGIAFLCFVACSSKGSQPAATPDDDAGETGTEDPLGPGPAPTAVNLAPACGTTGDAKLGFVRKTDAWDLDDAHLGVRGNHIQAIDLDHDGYPDLLIESGGSARSDTSLAGPQQLVRVLMNRPKDGGGRHFVDETAASNYGIARTDVKVPTTGTLLRASQLAVAGDVDNDGDLDVFSGVYVDPSKPDADVGDRNDIVLNDGKGKFALAPKSDLQTITGDLLPPTSSASFVDADRDGVLDLWIGFWYQVYGSTNYGVQARLLKGNGDGTFTDATKNSGLETTTSGYDAGKNHRPAYGVTTCDLNDDGAPELLLSAYGRQWNLLYQNLGGLKFAEIGQPSTYAGDSNVDYTDNEFYKCYCQTSGKCTPSSPPRLDCSTPSWNPAIDPKPWRNNGNTFTTVCADLNGDGKLDLYSAEIKHWHIGESADQSELLVNDGPTDTAPIHFTRPGRPATGLEWKHETTDWNEGGIMVAAADLDLDGMQDLIVGASDYPGNFSMIYRQKSPGVFEEIGEAVGLHHECTVGIAVADFDRDGDLDVVVGSSTARDCAKTWSKGNEVHLYENTTNTPGAPTNHGFLQVGFEGKGKGGSNRSGIGARVRILGEDGKVQMQELGGGYGHFGMEHDTFLTFGLGNSCAPKELEVRWPNGDLTKARYTGIGGGRRIVIKETGEVVEVAK
ncbi:MAG: CRTAC1 family protein [Polyangiales bacterium]